MDEKKEGKREKVISVFVNSEEKESLKDYAAADLRTLSSFLLNAGFERINKMEREKMRILQGKDD